MSTSFRIDRERGVVYARTVDETSSSDILRNLRALVHHPDYSEGMRLLFDMRDVRPSLVRSDVVRIGQFVRDHRDDIGSLKLAVVVPKDPSFGMAQEQKVELYGTFIDMEVFRDVAEARRWLGLPEEDQPPVDPDVVAH